MHPLNIIVVVVGFKRHAHHVPPCDNLDLFLVFLIIRSGNMYVISKFIIEDENRKKYTFQTKH